MDIKCTLRKLLPSNARNVSSSDIKTSQALTRKRKTQHAPIMGLPTELLTEIMSLVKEYDNDYKADNLIYNNRNDDTENWKQYYFTHDDGKTQLNWISYAEFKKKKEQLKNGFSLARTCLAFSEIYTTTPKDEIGTLLSSTIPKNNTVQASYENFINQKIINECTWSYAGAQNLYCRRNKDNPNLPKTILKFKLIKSIYTKKVDYITKSIPSSDIHYDFFKKIDIDVANVNTSNIDFNDTPNYFDKQEDEKLELRLNSILQLFKNVLINITYLIENKDKISVELSQAPREKYEFNLTYTLVKYLISMPHENFIKCLAENNINLGNIEYLPYLYRSTSFLNLELKQRQKVLKIIPQYSDQLIGLYPYDEELIDKYVRVIISQITSNSYKKIKDMDILEIPIAGQGSARNNSNDNNRNYIIQNRCAKYYGKIPNQLLQSISILYKIFDEEDVDEKQLGEIGILIKLLSNDNVTTECITGITSPIIRVLVQNIDLYRENLNLDFVNLNKIFTHIPSEMPLTTQRRLLEICTEYPYGKNKYSIFPDVALLFSFNSEMSQALYMHLGTLLKKISEGKREYYRPLYNILNTSTTHNSAPFNYNIIVENLLKLSNEELKNVVCNISMSNEAANNYIHNLKPIVT